MRELWIVGNATNKKPYMVVEYFRKENNFVGHKVLDRFKTREEAVKFRDDVLCEGDEGDKK